MKNTRNKINGMTKRTRYLSFFLVLVIGLVLGATAPQAWASGYHWNWKVPFAENEIFFEFNSTDLDLGIQIFFDAQAWKIVKVIGPHGKIFEVKNKGGLREIGSTEVFTESAEPPLCPEDEEEDECDVEAAIQEFQEKFPEGWYRFRGWTVERKMLSGWAYLSHDLPAAPEILSPEEGDTFENPFVIEWDAVDSNVIGYEVVAEMVIDGRTFVNTATLPGGATEFTVSPEFIELAQGAEAEEELEEFKVEVIRRTANLNKTITELVVFELEEE